ncbi:MAG: hypothetical protein M1822_001197 [Bathelium mastoideum]|nr:MAG: hypothetical protein M1822_001197 [Bathelium mastoideum]
MSLPTRTIFYLTVYGRNEGATAVINHPEKRRLRSISSDNRPALEVGFTKDRKTSLATLGRGDTDIFIDRTDVSRLQCSFEIDPDTNSIMLHDHFNQRTTQVFGQKAQDGAPFLDDHPRRVLVQIDFNTVICMGSERQGRIEFELVWPQQPAQTMDAIKKHNMTAATQAINPRQAQTVDDADTILPLQRQTRIHTSGASNPSIRYVTLGDPMGEGTFGKVYKAINVDTGEFLAVKRFKTAQGNANMGAYIYKTIKREVETIARCSHMTENSSVGDGY